MYINVQTKVYSDLRPVRIYFTATTSANGNIDLSAASYTNGNTPDFAHWLVVAATARHRTNLTTLYVALPYQYFSEGFGEIKGLHLISELASGAAPTNVNVEGYIWVLKIQTRVYSDIQNKISLKTVIGYFGGAVTSLTITNPNINPELYIGGRISSHRLECMPYITAVDVSNGSATIKKTDTASYSGAQVVLYFLSIN